MSQATITEVHTESGEFSLTGYMANELATLQSSPARAMRGVVEVPTDLMAEVFWLLVGRRGYMECAMQQSTPLPKASTGRGAAIARYAELSAVTVSTSERVWALLDAKCPGWRAGESDEIAG